MKSNAIKIFTMLFSIILISLNSWAIFGGVKTDPHMRNSLVSLVMKKGTCSSVLIAKNIILTAAHCTDMLGEPLKAVLLSKDPALKHCNTSNVIDYSYTPSAEAIFPRNVHAPDLVIVKLASDLCSGKVALITDEALSPGDILQATGFGGGSGVWYKSRQISLEVIAAEGASDLNTTEDSFFKELLRLSPDYYLYALPVEKNTTSCNGDSGGPLFVNNNGQMGLFAIHGAVFPNKHLGADKCNNGYLHLITPIAPYYKWIQSKIKLWNNL